VISALASSLAIALDQWFWAVLIPLSLQASILVFALAAIDHLLPRRTWPQLRSALWLLVFIRLIVPPSFGSPWALITAPEPVVTRAPDFLPWWAKAIPLAWALLTLLLGALLIWRHVATRRRLMRSSGSASFEALRREHLPSLARCASLLSVRAPRLLVTGEALGPLITGLWRPVLVMPADLLRKLPPERIEAVLLHELAHLRRGDLWVAALATGLAVMHWFNPLVWIASRRLTAVRELCCDRTVASAQPEILERYRAALLHVAAHSVGMRMPSSLRFVVPSRSLRLRLELLAEAAHELRGVRRVAVAGVLLLIVLFVLPASIDAEARSREVARWIDRPPGCMPLKYMVLEALVEEQRR
jgi:beta-lactamase regulating signal transducer with metallopeptidase domain